MNSWRNASLAEPADSGYGSSGGYGSDTGEAADAPRAAGRLAVWDSEELGEVVTDSEGFTLYRFDKDTAGAPESNREGAGAKVWPAVPAGDAAAAAGTDAELVGEVARADGTRKLAIGGGPMYRYAEDIRPGGANGQGVGGTWFAAAPDGKKEAANADAPTRRNRSISRDFRSERTPNSVTSSWISGV